MSPGPSLEVGLLLATMINKGKIFLRGNFWEGASGLICRKICPKTEILTGVDGQLLILLIATPIKIDVQHEFFVQKKEEGKKILMLKSGVKMQFVLICISKS